MTRSPFDDQLIEWLADEAEAGYSVDEIVARRGRRGRPYVGSAPSTTEPVCLDQEVEERAGHRHAEDEGET